MKRSFFQIACIGLVLLSCKENKSSGPIEAMEMPPKKESIDYHENYLREISYLKTREDSTSTLGMIKLGRGEFLMGSKNDDSKANEKPAHLETITPIWVDKTEVTNAEFREFVEATGYVTTAERSFDIKGKKYEAGALIFDPYNPEWTWKFVKGTTWEHPLGPDSDISKKDHFPVVQVSWYDAMAYAKWAGKRLPTEVEYEYFNRAGKDSLVYHWGNDAERASELANLFQGDFPRKNEKIDNFKNAAPVKSFPANQFGLYDTTGNVWEWCLDTYHSDAYSRTEEKKQGYFVEFQNMEQEKVIRGGSFLSGEAQPVDFRTTARMSAAPDFGMEHIGFRCVKDL